MALRDELDECFGCGDLTRVERALARAKNAPADEQSALFMPAKMLQKYAESLRAPKPAPRRGRGTVLLEPLSIAKPQPEPEPEPEPVPKPRKATFKGPALVRPSSRPTSGASAQSGSSEEHVARLPALQVRPTIVGAWSPRALDGDKEYEKLFARVSECLVYTRGDLRTAMRTLSASRDGMARLIDQLDVIAPTEIGARGGRQGVPARDRRDNVLLRLSVAAKRIGVVGGSDRRHH